MKTKNIWTVSIIHFINNTLGAILYGFTGENLVFTWKAILINLIIFSVVYGPFLLTDVYKNNTDIEINIE